MGKLLLEYAIVALLLICLAGLGAGAFMTHSDKLLAPFRTIGSTLNRGAKQ
jgi:hypothetical protein